MALAFTGTLAVPLEPQNVTVARAGEALAIHAPNIGFIKGEPLVRLKDGRTVRIDSISRCCPDRAVRRSRVADRCFF